MYGRRCAVGCLSTIAIAIAVTAMLVSFSAMASDADDSSNLRYILDDSGTQGVVIYTPDTMSQDDYYLYLNDDDAVAPTYYDGNRAGTNVMFIIPPIVGDYARATVVTVPSDVTPGEEETQTIFSGYLFRSATPAISISEVTGTVTSGQTVDLEATISPQGFDSVVEVQWTMNGEALDGDVETERTFTAPTVSSKTSCTVTASFSFEGATISDSATIIVVPEAPVINDISDVTFIGGQSATVTVSTTGGTPSSILPSDSERLTFTSEEGGAWSISLEAGVDPGFTEEVTFTATNDGGSDTETFNVTVNWEDVTSVEITGEVSSLAIGETHQFSAFVNNGSSYADQSVTWSVGENDPATITSEGLLTVRGSGTITVTATSGTESDSATITVSGARPITSAELQSSGQAVGSIVLLAEGSGSFQIVADAPIQSVGPSTSDLATISFGEPIGSSVTFTVTAGADDGDGVLNISLIGYDGQTFQMQVALEVTSTSHVVTITSGNGGSVTPIGANSVADGGSITVCIDPNRGFELDRMLVDGIEVEPIDGAYTITDVHSDITVSVTFVYVGSVVPPIDDDDDYVPIPPVIDNSGSDDDTTTIVACAAAAVVAALIAVFLIMEYRKR